MERDLFFIDQDNVNCVFHRKLYHHFLCNYVINIFGEKLDEESNKHFLKLLSKMTTFEDIVIITQEFSSYWMYMIMGKLKNGYAEYNKVDHPSTNEGIFQYEKRFLIENKVRGFIEEILPNGGFKASVWL